MVAAGMCCAGERLNVSHFLGVVVFLLGLPGRIAIARNHSDAEAINLMGWVGSAEAAAHEADAEYNRARLKYEAEIGGINTTVASI